MMPIGPGASRRRLFLAAALLIPFVAFASVEIGLRLVGFGGGDDLFVADPDWPEWRRADPDVLRRYMVSGSEPVARIAPIPFRAEKPADGLRLVVQGASTAAGFPFGRWGGLAGMLGDRLEAARPDDPIEVVTTALAAVNSNTLLDLVDEIIEIEPDAVLVYAGHNEYLGVLGVGSAFGSSNSLAITRLQMKLGRWRIYQLVGRLIACAQGSLDVLEQNDRQTLFARAASGSRVVFGSDLYRAGIAHFEANMGELLAKYRAAGIPVYIGTVVANDEFPPLARGPSDGVDAARWASARATHAAAVDRGDIEAERRAVEALIALDPDSAESWYARGQLAQREGRGAEARVALATARDRDTLRARAPTALNDSIRALAERHGAVLVDVEQRFRSESPDGVPGDALLLEHVHPNADGYFLLADTYFEALRRDGVLGELAEAPEREASRRDMPLTEFDRVLAANDMRELLAAYPFSEPPQAIEWGAPRNEIDRLVRRYRGGELTWVDAMEQFFQVTLAAGDFAGAARIARLVAHEYPSDAAINRTAGQLLIEAGHPARARAYLERSLRSEPDEPSTWSLLLRADRALGDHTAAARRAEVLDRLRRARPKQVARAVVAGDR